MRNLARASLDRLQSAAARPLDENALGAPALVFAPHPDDEVLGCGGTLLAKRARQAAVGIVYLTDGSRSHPPALIDPAVLRATRAREALDAAQALGVSPANVAQLGYPDGALATASARAEADVLALLEARRPQQVFLPFPVAEHPDHVATHDLVWRALRRSGRRYEVLEYPIWFWRHWPWVGLRGDRGEVADLLGRSSEAGFGLGLVTQFDVRVPIGPHLAVKRRALAAHATQTRRRGGDPGWWTLGDVSGGDFLRCFFGAAELFRRRLHPAGAADAISSPASSAASA